VVLQEGAALPEGTPVTVLCHKVRIRHKAGKNKQVKLPLVRSKHPGTLNLTNERMAEILQEEDVRAYSKFFPNLGTNLTIVKSRGRHAHFFHNGHLGYHNNMALRML
jgi:hypothetical protein